MEKIKKLQIRRSVEKGFGCGFALAGAGFAGATIALGMVNQPNAVPGIITYCCAVGSVLGFYQATFSGVQICCENMIDSCDLRIRELDDFKTHINQSFALATEEAPKELVKK